MKLTTTFDFARNGGWAVLAVCEDEMPAFVRLVAGVCETVALKPLPGEEATVVCPPWEANLFVPEGAADWRAEIYRIGGETALWLVNRQDAEALRRRLAEVAAL
jgi:hypothetical protein